MVLFFLQSLEIRSRLLINSVGCGACRPPFVELLRAELGRRQEALCEDCRRRTQSNPLRVLDCKVASCQPTIETLPRMTDHLCEECGHHFAQVQDCLAGLSIGYEIIPRLVRGLDYYVRTAFEIVSGELGAQNALAGGGRYDGLAEVIGGSRVPGFGFAMGLDRLAMILPDTVRARGKSGPELYIAHLGEAAFKKAISVSRYLRNRGFVCQFEPSGGSLKSQLRQAHRAGARDVLILGDEELARGRFQIKRMEDSSQLDVTMDELEEYLRKQRET